MKDKKIEITVETYEVLLIKQRGGLNRSWCASCGKQVALISLNDVDLPPQSRGGVKSLLHTPPV